MIIKKSLKGLLKSEGHLDVFNRFLLQGQGVDLLNHFFKDHPSQSETAQGGVLSPLLWLLVVNNILLDFEKTGTKVVAVAALTAVSVLIHLNLVLQ